jgi:hypothetical protein
MNDSENQITAFEAVAKFGERFRHLGKIATLSVDKFYHSSIIKTDEIITVEGREYKREIDLDLKDCGDYEYVITKNWETCNFHVVHKLYGNFKVYASFLEEKEKTNE